MAIRLWANNEADHKYPLWLEIVISLLNEGNTIHNPFCPCHRYQYKTFKILWYRILYEYEHMYIPHICDISIRNIYIVIHHYIITI